MSQSTINPYSSLGTDFSNGLVTFIGAYSSGTVTLTELISEINTIIEGDFYTSASAQQQIEINANTTNAINSYVNGLLWGNKTIYNARQMKFIRMLSREALRKIEVVTLNNYLLDVEDNITKSDLTVPEQIPLLIATMLGETAFSYWNTDVNATGASQKWTGYYQSNQAYNYANIPSWVAAAIEGALVGYGSSPDANLEPTTAMVSSKMIAALQGALAVNIALVALQMIPRITNPLTLNMGTVSALSGRVGWQYVTCKWDWQCDSGSVGPQCLVTGNACPTIACPTNATCNVMNCPANGTTGCTIGCQVHTGNACGSTPGLAYCTEACTQITC
jgi:hypothetical protein